MMKILVSLDLLLVIVALVRSRRDHEYNDNNEDANFDPILERQQGLRNIRLRNELVIDPEDLEKMFFPREVYYYLYTRRNPLEGQQLYVNNTEVLGRSNWKRGIPTRFFIHGWFGDHKTDGGKLVTAAYLSAGRYNVIRVNWSEFAKMEYVYIALFDTRLVGRYIAEMINFLTRMGMDRRSTVVIGYSIGAHVAGLTGLYTRKPIGHIVGLDPSPLLFGEYDDAQISKGQADIVQIIHTNTAILGVEYPRGDLDFYPNGGMSQPGCSIMDNEFFTDLYRGLDSFDWLKLCSHHRAWKYFAESIINPRGFYAVACRSWRSFRSGRCRKGRVAYMGNTNQTKPSEKNFYLYVNKKKPYARGKPKHRDFRYDSSKDSVIVRETKKYPMRIQVQVNETKMHTLPRKWRIRCKNWYSHRLSTHEPYHLRFSNSRVSTLVQ